MAAKLQDRMQKTDNGCSVLLVSAPGFANGWTPLNIARIKSLLIQKGHHANTMPLCVYFTDYITRHHSQFKKLDEEIGEFGQSWHELYFSATLFGHDNPEKLIMKSLVDMHLNKDIFYTNMNFGDNKLEPNPAILKTDHRRIMNYCRLLHKFLLRKMKTVDWQAYDIIGFSTMEAQFLTNLFMARLLKQLYGKKLTIVFGGPYFQPYNTEPIRKNFSEIDHIVVGNAEQGLLDFLGKFRKKTKLPKIFGTFADSSFAKGSAILSADVLNKFPPPDYDDVKAAKPGDYSLTTYVGSGCSHSKCSFCPITTTGQNLRSPQRIFDEIKFLRKRYGNRTIHFGDWEINGHTKTIEQLCDLLIKNRISIDSWAEINPRNTSPSLLKKMKKAGIDNVQIGIESFSENLLRAMGKPATVMDNVKVLKWGIEAGMYSLLFNIICNHPLGRTEDVQENFRIMRLIPHLLHRPVVAVLNEIELYRTSRLFREAEKFGISGIKDFEYYNRLYPKKILKNQIPMFNLAFRGLHVHPMWKRVEKYLEKIKKKPVTLSARKLKKGLLIYDSRNRRVKRYKLYGLEADVLLSAMDTIENTDDLRREHCISEDRINTSVNRLIKKGLILKKGNRILALPLKAGAH
ncbi:MAG: radical SAM protein [Phycisphaerae bacterium]|nr:radical SAM protein [Phycisphaerae bacterium]